MIDEKYEVHPQIAQAMPKQPEPEVVQEVEQEPAEIAPQEQQHPIQQETEQQIRFKMLRKEKERIERERDEAVRIAQQYQQQKLQTQDDTDDLHIGNDDIAEGKHLKEIYKEVKRLKSEVNQYKQHFSTQTSESRLKQQFPDFDKVVTKENVELLAQLHPPVANTIRNSELYDAGYMAYTMIKQLNIDTPVSNESERIQKNVAKPRPTNSIAPQQGENPLTRANTFANGLTEELKAQLLKEMNAYRKDY